MSRKSGSVGARGGNSPGDPATLRPRGRMRHDGAVVGADLEPAERFVRGP
jgi:hypothetical protein